MKILVIDSDGTFRTVMKGMLEEFLVNYFRNRKGSFSVKTAENAKDGFSKIQEGDFNLVIVSNRLLKTDGEEFEAIKKINSFDAEIKTIMVGDAIDPHAAKQKALALGADDFVDRSQLMRDFMPAVVQLFPNIP
jgi:CheY-like chemotaxis protein